MTSLRVFVLLPDGTREVFEIDPRTTTEDLYKKFYLNATSGMQDLTQITFEGNKLDWGDVLMDKGIMLDNEIIITTNNCKECDQYKCTCCEICKFSQCICCHSCLSPYDHNASLDYGCPECNFFYYVESWDCYDDYRRFP